DDAIDVDPLPKGGLREAARKLTPDEQVVGTSPGEPRKAHTISARRDPQWEAVLVENCSIGRDARAVDGPFVLVPADRPAHQEVCSAPRDRWRTLSARRSGDNDWNWVEDGTGLTEPDRA